MSDPIQSAQALVNFGISTENLPVASAGVSALWSLSSSEAEFMALLGQVAAGQELTKLAQLVKTISKKIPRIRSRAAVVDWKGMLHLVTRHRGARFVAEVAELGIVASGSSKAEARKACLKRLDVAIAQLWSSYSRHRIGDDAGGALVELVNVTANLQPRKT